MVVLGGSFSDNVIASKETTVTAWADLVCFLQGLEFSGRMIKMTGSAGDLCIRRKVRMMSQTRSSSRLLVPIVLLFLLVLTRAAPHGDADDDDDLDDLDDLEAELAAAGDVGLMGRAQRLLVGLNDQNIERVIGAHEYVLLLGYAPWCTRSSALMPEFAAAATILADGGSPVLVAKVDAVANPTAAARYGIKGYPTILFFTNGTAQRHNGGQTRDEFVNWVRKRTGFPATGVSTPVEAEEILKRKVTFVVGYFEKFEGLEYEEFVSVAKEEDGTEFLQIDNAEVVKLFKSISPDGRPAIGLQKNEPEFFVSFGGNFSKEEISDFVEVNKHPLVTRLTMEKMMKVYSSIVQHQVLLFASSEDYQQLSPVLLETAALFKGKIMFIWVDLGDEDLSRPMLAVYGLSHEKPSITAFHNGLGLKHFLDAEATSDNLQRFCAEFLAGNLPLHFKSQPVPEEDDGDVKVVVGKTLSQYLENEAKDLFLQVSTPWCVTCEKVNKAFHRVASHLKDVPSIVFGTIDASSNEHPRLEVNTFPTLLFYPAGSDRSSPVIASKFSAKDILQFVREQAAVPFSAPDLPKPGKRKSKLEDGTDTRAPGEAGEAREPSEEIVSVHEEGDAGQQWQLEEQDAVHEDAYPNDTAVPELENAGPGEDSDETHAFPEEASREKVAEQSDHIYAPYEDGHANGSRTPRVEAFARSDPVKDEL